MNTINIYTVKDGTTWMLQDRGDLQQVTNVRAYDTRVELSLLEGPHGYLAGATYWDVTVNYSTTTHKNVDSLLTSLNAK